MNRGHYVGSGGFAEVYKKNNEAVKYLKSDLMKSDNLKHRFKREFEITNSLKDIDGIIPVFNFVEDENEMHYSMPLCDTDLYKKISNDINFDNENLKLQYIKTILKIMSQVHEKNCIHRDLSPTNILIKDNELLLTDFGLGKNIDKNYTYETTTTANFGQIAFSSPEQINLLKEATKQSDVYSLGKIINFILKNNPSDTDHVLKFVSVTATAENQNYRYKDAKQMADDVLTTLSRISEKNFEDDCINKIESKIYDEDVSTYLATIDPIKHYNNLEEVSSYRKALINHIISDKVNSYNFLDKLEESMSNCSTFESYDVFGIICYKLLLNNLDAIGFDAQRKAIEILKYVANDINRYNAQDKIDNLIEHLIKENDKHNLVRYLEE